MENKFYKIKNERNNSLRDVTAVDPDIIIEKFFSMLNIRRYNKSKGVCINYALKNYNISTFDEAKKILNRKFKEVKFDDLKVNDLVCFYKRNKFIELKLKHFAVVCKLNKTLNKVEVKSKFGDSGIFKGSLSNMPSVYGNLLKFYRRI